MPAGTQQTSPAAAGGGEIVSTGRYGQELYEWKMAILIMVVLLTMLAIGHRLGRSEAEEAVAAPDCTCHCDCSEDPG